MLWIILGITVSYLIGSIPTAYLFGRALKGIDIRKFGSGNVGATNALRVLGKGPGIAVLVLDIIKGFLAVVLLGDFLVYRATFVSPETLRLILGISCICGHNWTFFLGFKGGKGVATTLGVLLGLSLKISTLKLILPLLVLVWLVTFLATMIVSLASVLTAIALPILVIFFRPTKGLILTSILLCAFIILRHRTNLKRVFQGKEPRLNFKKTSY
jgi:glycerol-3-phosphate acyltransferase PlsY